MARAGGVKPLQLFNAGVQLSATHCLQAAVSPPIHFNQHLEAVQEMVVPKHAAQPSEYPSFPFMHAVAFVWSPKEECPQAFMSESKLAWPFEVHTC